MGREPDGQDQQHAITQVMARIFSRCQPGLHYRLWDGSEGSVGKPDGTFTIVIRDRDTFRRALASGDTGRLATAFVEQGIDIEGDLLACIRIANQLEGLEFKWWEKLHLWWSLRRI